MGIGGLAPFFCGEMVYSAENNLTDIIKSIAGATVKKVVLNGTPKYKLPGTIKWVYVGKHKTYLTSILQNLAFLLYIVFVYLKL